MPVEIRRVLLEAAVIFALGVVIGLSFNYRLVMNAFSGKVAAPPPVAPVSSEPALFPAPVDLETLKSLLSQGAVLIDARAVELYRDGHIAGALSLPLGEVDAALEPFMQKVPLTATLIAYCNGYGCPDSFDLGVLLLKEGYQDVQVYEGGLPEWRDAGLPVTRGEP